MTDALNVDYVKKKNYTYGRRSGIRLTFIMRVSPLPELKITLIKGNCGNPLALVPEEKPLKSEKL